MTTKKYSLKTFEKSIQNVFTYVGGSLHSEDLCIFRDILHRILKNSKKKRNSEMFYKFCTYKQCIYGWKQIIIYIDIDIFNRSKSIPEKRVEIRAEICFIFTRVANHYDVSDNS